MQISECATEVKTMAVIRTHFTFRVDTWTADGESIVEHVAGVEVARPQFPQAKVPLKKFGEVAKLNPLRSRNCLAPKKILYPRDHMQSFNERDCHAKFNSQPCAQRYNSDDERNRSSSGSSSQRSLGSCSRAAFGQVNAVLPGHLPRRR